ncbi:cilia- and flagella-associated protein 157 [Chaetodon auriga]|uniref:cilia- and flagella-associated protein 157 n=1 Tax=Chaetodon auriga TaxID=39042 RepID=UPI004032D89E
MDRSGPDNREKPLELIQMQYLEEQLESCQLNYDKLEKQNKDLTSRYSALEAEKKDITENLKQRVAAKEREGGELAEQLESQQQAMKLATKALKLKIQETQELQERVNELNSGNTMQAAKCEEQEEQLMQQLSDMESMKKQLVSQEKEHEAAIHRLVMEAELEMKKIPGGIQKTLADCVKMKTSKLLRKERAEHSKRLKWNECLLKDAVALQKEIDALRDRERDLCVKRDSLKKDVSKITQEILVHEKEAKPLKKKCQQLEVELKDCSITNKHLLAEDKNVRQELASVSEQCAQKAAEISPMRVELQRLKSRNRELEGVMQDAVIILRHILTGSENGSDTQWKTGRLLDILENTAPQGTVSTLNVSTENSRRGQKPQTSLPLL